MANSETAKTSNGNFFKNLVRNQCFIPIAALLLLAVFNLIADPSFFKITLGYNSAGDPVLSGFIIDIINNGSELAILAIGMTLVTAASGGQDISVGAAALRRIQRYIGGLFQDSAHDRNADPVYGGAFHCGMD